MKQALIYSLKVWLTGVAVALMITWIADSIAPYVFSDYIYSGVFGRIAEVLIFSLAYAVPFCIGVSILSAFDLKITSVKLTLTFFTLIAGWLPVIALTNIIDEPISFGYTQEALVYILINCLGIWLYKPVLLSSKNMNFKFKGIKRIEGMTTPSPTYS
jgi:hypothetical protein